MRSRPHAPQWAQTQSMTHRAADRAAHAQQDSAALPELLPVRPGELGPRLHAPPRAISADRDPRSRRAREGLAEVAAAQGAFDVVEISG